MFSSILAVCIGNICRSPMAEALLKARFGPGTRVASAGLHALEGYPADPLAVELCAERGLDLSGHRARQLTRGLVAEAELVLVMDDAQRRAVEAILPAARGRVHRFGRFGGFDVPDPFRGTRADFERALALVERGIDDFERALGGSREAK